MALHYSINTNFIDDNVANRFRLRGTGELFFFQKYSKCSHRSKCLFFKQIFYFRISSLIICNELEFASLIKIHESDQK